MSDYDENRYRSSTTANGALLTVSAPGAGEFCPLTTPRPGSFLSPIKPSSSFKVPKLLLPLKLRSLEFKNRVFLSPMAQYSCEPGTGNPSRYHLVSSSCAVVAGG